MRKAPCKNAGQSSLQEAPVNPEGVREIIHPAPSRNQGGIYKRDFSIDKKGMRPLGLCPHDSARRMPPDRRYYSCMVSEDDTPDCTLCWSNYMEGIAGDIIELPKKGAAV